MRTALALAFLFVSCTPNQPRVAPAPAAETVMAGQKLFHQHCAMCHGVAAVGTRYAPDLHAPEVQAMDPDALFVFVTNGDLRNGMPAWARLTDERRWQLVAYLKSLRTR